MRSIVSLLWGTLLLLFGCTLLAWVGYNLFIERQPETEDKNPFVALAVGVAAIGLGFMRLRRGIGKDG